MTSPKYESKRCGSNLPAGLLVAVAIGGACSSGSGNGQAQLPESHLELEPSNAWVLSFPHGSPLPATTRVVTISTSEPAATSWSAQVGEPWVVLSKSTGISQPADPDSTVLSLDPSVVAGLAPGLYECEVEFSETRPSQPVVMPVALAITSTQASLVVTPEQEFAASGPQGGPFAPLAAAFQVENDSLEQRSWSVVAATSWISLAGASSGSLGPGETAQVEVQINQVVAGALSPATYEGAVTFVEGATSTPFAVRGVVLEVKSATGDGGWTDFVPSVDTRIVYVSNSQGSDTNSGFSAAEPRRSIAAALTLIRDGYPDWLLLRRGDTWETTLTEAPWTRSGRGPGEPLRIGAYGTGPRPILSPAQEAGSVFYVAGGDSSYIAITDLHMRPKSIVPDFVAGGVEYFGSGTDILVEGCLIEQYYNGITFFNLSPQGPRNVKVRRNVIVDTQRRGLLALGVKGYLAEQNSLVRIGSTNPALGTFHQAMYIANEYNIGVQLRGNLVAECLSGTQLRPGGIVDDNLYVRCSAALQVGGGTEPQFNPDGVEGLARNNVVLESSQPPWASLGLGWGITLENIKSCLVERNIIANAIGGSEGMAIYINGLDTGAKAHDITLRHNIAFNWTGRGIFIKGAQVTNLLIEENELQDQVNDSRVFETIDESVLDQITSRDNRVHSSLTPFSTWFLSGGSNLSLDQYKAQVGDSTSTAVLVPYGDPEFASIAGYLQSLGLQPTYEAFIAEVLKQNKDSWRTEYTAAAVNDYVRGVFGW